MPKAFYHLVSLPVQRGKKQGWPRNFVLLPKSEVCSKGASSPRHSPRGTASKKPRNRRRTASPTRRTREDWPCGMNPDPAGSRCCHPHQRGGRDERCQRSEQERNGEEAVRSIMMTSTAKMMAATGALKSAASDAERRTADQQQAPVERAFGLPSYFGTDGCGRLQRRSFQTTRPPNPTESELVINEANIQVRLMRPWRWDKACKMLGTPGPGCSPRSQFRTTHRVANRPIKGPIPSHQLHADHAAKPDMPSCNPPTTRFNKTANNPAAKPVRTAQPKSADRRISNPNPPHLQSTCVGASPCDKFHQNHQ